MVITAFLLCIIYALKGIFPFGSNTIDYYDMAQQITAFYYHTFDFLHGEKNLFYDPYTALSVNMAMSTSGCSHLSPFNLFFLFVKREALLESLSIFLMIKMMFMSLFMYIYVHNRYKTSFFNEVIFSVGYAFCGYVMMLYMTIHWLDVAALFPLLILFLHKLLKDGKSYGYIATLTIMLIASYYQSFMILIYIILMAGVVLFCDRIFRKNGYEPLYDNYHLLKLLLATVLSLIISSFIVIPQMMQTLNSARFNNENGGGLLATYLGIVGTVKPAYTSRWWSLLGLSFAFAVIAYGLYIFRKDRKTVALTVLTLVVMLSELVVEGVNLFWHFGSYVGYPIRNGYMIYFTIACVALGFIEKMTSDQVDLKPKTSVFIAIGSAAFIICCGVFYVRTDGLVLRDVFHLTSLVMAVLFVAYLLMLIINKGCVSGSVSLILCAEIVLFGFIMLGKPAYSSVNTSDPEQEGEYISKCIQLDEAFSLNAVDNSTKDNLLFSRVKNPDTSLNANYGLILRRPVLSNWTHILSPLLQRDAAKLGYSVQYTRLLDSGGTAFSDALLGVNEVISALPLDEKLYELKDKTEVTDSTGESTAYYLYESRYTLPFGVVTDSIDYDFENADTVEIYNAIYRSLTGKREEIACEYDAGNITVTGKKALYYYSGQVDTDDYNTSVYVNGKLINVPSISEPDNTLYPAHFNNNFLYLGTFENESADIKLTISDVDKAGNEITSEVIPKVISIDLDMLSELTESYADAVSNRAADKSVYSFSVTAENDSSYLLLPLSYDKGYEAQINGVSEEVLPAGGLFSAVRLKKGDNNIILKFVPYGMKQGICISIVGIVLLVIFIYLGRKSTVLDMELKWLNNLYFVLFICVMIFMYAIPYLFGILSLVHIV